MIDDAGRSYRDGDGMHVAKIALAMAGRAVGRLAPDGRFILYTGSAVAAERDARGEQLNDPARENGCWLRHEGTHPDVFGEELEDPAYRNVERIAVIERLGAAR